MHAFERELSTPVEEVGFEFRSIGPIACLYFWLNPRRIRGSDFLMRWSQGRWSEDMLIQAVNRTGRFIAIPYGPSSTAPDDDPRASELYFERLEAAGLDKIKRPDLLLFRSEDEPTVRLILETLEGVENLPFQAEDHPQMAQLINKSIVAVECENSLWRSQKMRDYNSVLKPQRRLGGKLGVKKSAILPTVIIKDEDRARLIEWQTTHNTPIHVWHAFYDLAFGLSLTEAERLIAEGFIEPHKQIFQAPGGATTSKIIYKYPYLRAYALGRTVTEPSLEARFIEDKNGHILPFVHFEGGQIDLDQQALEVLENLAITRK